MNFKKNKQKNHKKSPQTKKKSPKVKNTILKPKKS